MKSPPSGEELLDAAEGDVGVFRDPDVMDEDVDEDDEAEQDGPVFTPERPSGLP